mmetsp:Transcript_36495/g.116981  ORF Transcript_36495/g.116981 Transcript_36495/m.116981 type:complete len:208 (+) Transcript_36495:75-698(+)
MREARQLQEAEDEDDEETVVVVRSSVVRRGKPQADVAPGGARRKTTKKKRESRSRPQSPPIVLDLEVDDVPQGLPDTPLTYNEAMQYFHISNIKIPEDQEESAATCSFLSVADLFLRPQPPPLQDPYESALDETDHNHLFKDESSESDEPPQDLTPTSDQQQRGTVGDDVSLSPTAGTPAGTPPPEADFVPVITRERRTPSKDAVLI